MRKTKKDRFFFPVRRSVSRLFEQMLMVCRIRNVFYERKKQTSHFFLAFHSFQSKEKSKTVCLYVRSQKLKSLFVFRLFTNLSHSTNFKKPTMVVAHILTLVRSSSRLEFKWWSMCLIRNVYICCYIVVLWRRRRSKRQRRIIIRIASLLGG